MPAILRLRLFGNRKIQELNLRTFAKLSVVLGIFLLSAVYAGGSSDIRVLILQDAGSFGLKTEGPYKIKDAAGEKVLSSGRGMNYTVTVYTEGILIGEDAFRAGKLIFSAGDDGEVIINGRRFRGEVEFIKNNSGRISLVNRINLEDYIRGILYHEASHYWPMEVLKAQAIACRSYAVYQMNMNQANDYDVTSDIYSQVYGGKTSERYRTNMAVDKTRGIILTYNNKPLPAFFHATCGGHTQDAFLVWGIDSAALKGLPCGFCKKSPHYNWHCELPAKEIKGKLNKTGYKIKDIKDMLVAGRDDSGRITDLEITGYEEKIPANKLRSILGPNIIRSTNFTVRVEGADAVFEGLGWGHGVGMCQWGAYFLAKEGKSYKEILDYYYPGAKIETVGF